MNKFYPAVQEAKSVLDEWLPESEWAGARNRAIAEAVVQRLIAKGIIQSDDPDELVKVY